MMIETIWASLYSAVAILIPVSGVTGGLYLIGHYIFKLLRLPNIKSSSVDIAAGMATVTFFSWYAYRLGIPLNIFIVGVFFIEIVLLIFALVKYVKAGALSNSSSIYILPFFAFAFAVQALIAFNATGYPIGVMGNNDIYDWSILAQHILGEPGYSNVMTTLGGAAQQNRIDSFGTFFIIALVAKFLSSSPIEASTIFTIFCLSLIGLSVFDLVRKAFDITHWISFGVALLIPAGSFFFYIAYDNFYAQLLATFFYLTLITSLLYVALNNQLEFGHFTSRVTLPLFALLGILIVYPSGFFVFTIFAIIFSFSYSFVSNANTKNYLSVVRIKLQHVLLPLICGILLSAIIVPELALHMLKRTLIVKDVLNGWPLPLISPVYLFSIPVNTPFPILIGSMAQYLFSLLTLALVFGISYFATKRKNSELASRLLVFIVFFGISLFAYMLAYWFKGGVYQVWKLAAFIVLPMSFVIFAGIVLGWRNVIKPTAALHNLLLFVVIVSGCAFAVAVAPAKLRLNTISQKIEQLKSAKRILLNNGVENVVLDSMGFDETMLAFNVFSDQFKLYPLVRSYVAPVDMDVVARLDEAKTRGLVNNKCLDPELSSVDGYRIVGLKEMLAGRGKQYRFGTSDARCSTLNVQLVEGFSGREAWGVWTEGDTAKMQLALLPEQVGKEISITFQIQQFGAVQRVRLAAGSYSKGWEITKKTDIAVTIPAEITSEKNITLYFHIDNPMSPHSIDPAVSDMRLLGVGFISMRVM